jgi:phage baseplate assembly protein W
VSGIPFLGRGWGFPILPAADSRALPYVEDAEAVQQAILTILDTDPGERIMRPEFGCGLRRYLMQPNTVAVRALIQHDVDLALRTQEPRIDLASVEVEPGDDPSLVLIAVAYRHARDGRAGNFVYPFYLQ